MFEPQASSLQNTSSLSVFLLSRNSGCKVYGAFVLSPALEVAVQQDNTQLEKSRVLR